MNLEFARRLIAPESASILTELAADVACERPTPALIGSLRKTFGPDFAPLLLEQAALRRRARVKFSQAERMFFTRRSLEQASDEAIARWKSRRFPANSPLAELCCGIGGDAIALAQRGGATCWIDRDPLLTMLAAANAAALGLSQVSVQTEDVTACDLAAYAAWHIDPDRRSEGGRTMRVERSEPDDAALERLLSLNSSGAIKLAPGARLPLAWSARAECEWISSRGECRQQVAWFGALTEHAGRRLATVIDARGDAVSLAGAGDEPIEIAPASGPFLFDPDPAVLASGLLGAAAQSLHAQRFSHESPYLTGDRAIHVAWAACFEIESEEAYDQRKLHRLFQERGVGRLEIKKRGVELTPEAIRPKLVGKGDAEATLILAARGKSIRAMIARRVVTG